jgi:hypothetical protein
LFHAPTLLPRNSCRNLNAPPLTHELEGAPPLVSKGGLLRSNVAHALLSLLACSSHALTAPHS